MMNAAMKAKLAAAKNVGPNMNEAQSGGGGTYTPPAEGKAVRLRFVGYFETGNHTEQSGQYAGKKTDRVELVFELSGRLWAPTEHDGKKVPQRMTLRMNFSLNEKATFFKLFKVMNAAHGDTATIMAELLGREFIGDITHTKKGDKVYANLVNVRKAERENDEGEIVPIIVDEPLTEIKFFIWDIADMEMWDSIFIDGEYPERKNDKGEVTAKAKSKNVIQNLIRSANNFDTLPIAGLLRAGMTAADEKSLDESLGDDDASPFAPSEPGSIDDCM